MESENYTYEGQHWTAVSPGSKVLVMIFAMESSMSYHALATGCQPSGHRTDGE